MKRKRPNALGKSMTKHYLQALDRLGLPMPVLRIDHLPKGDEFDDWLTVVQFADLMIYEDGQLVAVLTSYARHKRLRKDISSGERNLSERE